MKAHLTNLAPFRSFFNVGTPIGVNLFDHLLWSIFQPPIKHIQIINYGAPWSCGLIYHVKVMYKSWCQGSRDRNPVEARIYIKMYKSEFLIK